MLNRGEIPNYEPGLEDLILANVEAGRLGFTTDIDEGVAHGLFQFIAVGTPPDEDGSADLRHVLAVARSVLWRFETFGTACFSFLHVSMPCEHAS